MHFSKSDFLKYQICPSYLWLWKHKKDVVPVDEEEDIKRRLEQGNEVELIALELFPDGELVNGAFTELPVITEQLVREGKKTIFQAAVLTDEKLLAIADVITYDDKSKSWTLYEIKSTNSVKPEHVSDVAFQRVAFEAAGYKIGSVGVIYLNKDYVRRMDVIAEDFFITEDITDRVGEILPTIREQVKDALKKISEPNEPKSCSCRLKTKSGHCPTFHYLNPDIPEYSVFNISRIGQKNLSLLVDDYRYHVHEVGDDIKLSINQRNQVDVAKAKQPMIDHAQINSALDDLVYPLYFLDYETVSTAIPLYNGCTPFQQIPFQYSLHILREPGGELEHYEYLGRNGKQSPVPELLTNLRSQIGKTGSVIVWYEVFEKGRNSEMAHEYPEYAEFLNNVNDRVYDLMEVFSKQHFVHPNFNGSTSIKAVLPVLAPNHSYKEMDIQNGQNASVRWFDAVTGAVDADTAEHTFDALLKYCCLDTLAMVEIYKYLTDLVSNHR